MNRNFFRWRILIFYVVKNRSGMEKQRIFLFFLGNTKLIFQGKRWEKWKKIKKMESYIRVTKYVITYWYNMMQEQKKGKSGD